MSAYDYKFFVNDFIDRTNTNLEVINKIFNSKEKENYKVYEITQLINSLFGLLIVPHERYKNLNERELKKRKGYNELLSVIKKIHKKYTSYEGDVDCRGNIKISRFIKHLRNALAHSGDRGVLFLDENNELAGMIFYDEYEKEKKPKEQFCIELDFDSLKQMVRHIVDIYSDNDYEGDVDYNQDIMNKRELFEDRVNNSFITR